ncbi:hypothetical protein RJ640_015038 [Escallonia rubra]|uniref:DUF4283 domain-containing protein n=1 Tax=Escallonia rubra TaxID=112253 RepID=A0AA88RRA7_9ASTE|nr:hypothetical protein RJ640_015038 [Escallonia rubra]
MKFMLNEQELEEHLTKEMVAPTEGQPLRDHTAYQKWNEKERSARYTLLSSLQNDLIGQFDELPTCKSLWDQLKFSFGGTSTTRLRSLVIKFEECTKDPKYTMSEHLRMMSNMIGKLRDAGHALTDEQQVRAVIRSLPASWVNMKQILTHSESIKNFSDVSQHVILEAETRDADKTPLMSPKRDRSMQMASAKDKVRKGYVMCGEHPNGGRTEIESPDVDFIESDFPSIGDAKTTPETTPNPSPIGEPPPNHVSIPAQSFKNTLLRHLKNRKPTDMEVEFEPPIDDEEVHEQDGNRHRATIPKIIFSQNIKEKIRKPWQQMLIIKMIGALYTTSNLNNRLHGIWKPSGTIQLIDLTNEFYPVKFNARIDYSKAFEKGPWFIGTSYLSVQRWTPNFNPHNINIHKIAVWIRLNNLPLEYFDREVLLLSGMAIGTPLRIDSITQSITRGRFARIYGQIDTQNPITNNIQIG